MIIGPIQWKGLSSADIPSTALPGACSVITDYNIVRGCLNVRKNTSALYDWGLVNYSDVFYWEDSASYPGIAAAAVLILPTSNSLGKIYVAPYDENFTLVPVDRTGTYPANGNTGGTADSLNGYFVLCGYSTNPVCTNAYNANFAALGGSPPSAYFNKTVNNFMFLSGNLTNQSRVYWSNVVDPNTWGAANYVDFRKSDGDIVSALWALNNDLLIFKRSSIGKLSTTPPNTSVSVTLGPLTTISEKIGCAGPRAVDTLPDGTIVFLGSDMCLYQFDGVVIKNLSKQPSPGPDVGNSLGWAYPWTGPGSGNLAPIVKYYPPLKAILVVTSGVSTQTWMYFMDENAWTQYSGQRILSCCIAGPTRPLALVGGVQSHKIIYSSYYPIVSGRSRILPFDGANGGSAGPCDDTGTTITALATTQISPTPDQYDFIPRSLILPTYKVSTLKVKFGWDNVMSSTYAYNTTIGPPSGNFKRLVVPIPRPQVQGGSGSGLTLAGPWVLTIQVEANGSGTYADPTNLTSIGPFYLSDEVASGATY